MVASGYSGSKAIAASLVLSCAFLAQAQTTQVKTNLKKVLVLDKSQGGANGHLESRRDLNRALNELATAHGFTVTIIGQNDPASTITTQFSAASLATYQAVILSNNDGVHAQLSATDKTNLENYVKGGGGLIPIHAASAFISNWAWLTNNLVKSFYGPHGSNQPRANLAHDAEGTKDGTETKGIFKGLTAPLAFLDEYYSFNGSPRGVAGVTILTTVDERSFSATVQGPMGNDHPVNWAKTDGQGRVVHMSMGHSWSTNNVYTASNSYLKNFLYGVLRYTAGDFVGCTDNAFEEYKPDATKSDPTACKTRTGVHISTGNSNGSIPMLSRLQSNEKISIKFNSAGAHEVLITDMRGQAVDSRSGTGSIQYELNAPQKSGIYLIKTKVNGKANVQRITVL